MISPAAEASGDAGEETPAAGKAMAEKSTPGQRLAPYVARLTAKAHPVFFFFTALILLLTGIASFIFIGNFIIATDDVVSRVYDNKAFMNGDRTRIVAAKAGREAFTDGEIALIGEQRYVSRVEKYGYLCDLRYYYREDVDYRTYTSADYAEDYHPIENPGAVTYSEKVKFLAGDPQYIRSVSQAGEIRRGRQAEGFYEVLSSDPDLKTGTEVRVLIRDEARWAVSRAIDFRFVVVGETSGERGLYFSESFCRMLNASALAGIYNQGGTYFSGGDIGKYPVAPFDRERLSEYLTADSGEAAPDSLADNEFIVPPDPEGRDMKLGSVLSLNVGAWYTGAQSRADGPVGTTYDLVCAGYYTGSHSKLVIVSPATFEKMTGDMGTNQISVFIDDYAYTERVIDELVSLGCVALSPYMQGSTARNETLETERLNLLRISLAASVLTLVLQLILLRVTFSSLKDHYRLLSHMGLRGKTAQASLALLFVYLTVIAEIIAAAVIWLLNRQGYERVVNIFKYLEAPKLVLIFAVHLLFCAIAYFAAARTIRKQVFTISGFYEDMDGELMEEVMVE